MPCTDGEQGENHRASSDDIEDVSPTKACKEVVHFATDVQEIVKLRARIIRLGTNHREVYEVGHLCVEFDAIATSTPDN